MQTDDGTPQRGRALAAEAAAPAGKPRPRRVASATLFGGVREVVIEHAGREYRLRITQNDKLILTA